MGDRERRKSAFKTILPYVFTTAVAAVMIFLCYCTNCFGRGILLSHDLAGKNLYIHNETCSEMYVVRPVEDDEMYREIAAICTKAIKFRTHGEDFEMTLGISDMPVLHFIGKNANRKAVKYEVTLLEADKQLSEDYVHYEEPLVAVSMWSKDLSDDSSMEGRYFVSKWFWYCSLPQEDYARLCELVLTYDDGEKMKAGNLR